MCSGFGAGNIGIGVASLAIANETIHERMVEWRIALVSKVSQWLSLDSTEAELIYNQSYKRSNKMSWEVAEYHQRSW